MATYFGVPSIVATSTLDRVGREERLHQDMPKRQRFTNPLRARKKTSGPEPEPEGIGIFDLIDGVDAPERHFDVTA